METFAFTLVLLEGLDDAKVDALFGAGCGDASFGCVDGVCFGDFDREAETLEDAIASAMAAVESVPGLTVVRVEPDDLVTMSEIAQRLGRTRESVRLLIAGERGPGMFPPPVSHLRTHNRLWRWNEVAGWARDAGIAGSGVSVEAASLIAAVNAALQMRTVAPPAAKAARAMVGSLPG